MVLVWKTDQRRGITAWWREFNDDFRPHEIVFYQAHIERSGQPVPMLGVERESPCFPISERVPTWMALSSQRT